MIMNINENTDQQTEHCVNLKYIYTQHGTRNLTIVTYGTVLRIYL